MEENQLRRGWVPSQKEITRQLGVSRNTTL